MHKIAKKVKFDYNNNKLFCKLGIKRYKNMLMQFTKKN